MPADRARCGAAARSRAPACAACPDRRPALPWTGGAPGPAGPAPRRRARRREERRALRRGEKWGLSLFSSHRAYTGRRTGGVMNRTRIGALLAAIGLAAALSANAQAPSGRTLEELKAEAQARADRNAYPLNGLKPEDVREALGRLKSLDRDEWAASWSEVGERYMARQDYHQAFLYYSFARWPVPN